METRQIILYSVLSGIFISIGGWAFLAIGGVIGMVMFAFGLLAVVHFGTTLYTGTAGFAFKNSGKYWKLPLILLFNVVGCVLIGALTRMSSLELAAAAEKVVTTRINAGFFNSIGLGIGCGIIMTTAVAFAPDKRYLTLLFGVPVFIACGFFHSIADAFYISSCSLGFLAANWSHILISWVGVVIGNFIGCNIQKILGIHDLVKSI